MLKANLRLPDSSLKAFQEVARIDSSMNKLRVSLVVPFGSLNLVLLVQFACSQLVLSEIETQLQFSLRRSANKRTR